MSSMNIKQKMFRISETILRSGSRNSLFFFQILFSQQNSSNFCSSWEDYSGVFNAQPFINTQPKVQMKGWWISSQMGFFFCGNLAWNWQCIFPSFVEEVLLWGKPLFFLLFLWKKFFFFNKLVIHKIMKNWVRKTKIKTASWNKDVYKKLRSQNRWFWNVYWRYFSIFWQPSLPCIPKEVEKSNSHAISENNKWDGRIKKEKTKKNIPSVLFRFSFYRHKNLTLFSNNGIHFILWLVL
jgi:hypothetical protein